MSLYSINIISKNKKSLNKFFDIFTRISETTQFGLTNKINSQKSKKKIITILKSPHVNKKAQEQFELSYFNYKFNIYSPQELKLILMVKKIQKKLFTDIKIKINVISSGKISEQKKQKLLNPLNIKIENLTYYNFSVVNLKNPSKSTSSAEKYIKSLDIYGETFLSLGS